MPQPDPAGAPYRPRAFFVYYKVERSQAARLRQAFAAMTAVAAGATASAAVAASAATAPTAASAATAACAAPWRAELMRRVEPAGSADAADDGLQTWMEIYWLREDDPAPGAGPALPGSAARAAAQAWDGAQLREMIEARARAAGLLDLVRGERHYEAFESCA